MSTAVQHRRGTTAQHETFAGAVGEITVDTDKKVAVVHDGSTPGGTPLARESVVAELAEELDGKAGVSVYASKSAGYTAAKTDAGAIHRCSAEITVALTAATTLGANWTLTVIADGGDVTIDPDSSETINGEATLVVADGDAAYLICTGSGFKAVTIPSAASVATRVDTAAAQSFTAAQQAQGRSNISAALKGHIYGMTLSNNATDATNDIDIAAGEAASTETTPVLMLLATSMTKQLDSTWSVGTNAGGRDTGSISDGVWYVFLIQRSDTGVVDVLFSKSKTSPTMPANYDRKRRVGSFIRYSNAICAFVQTGDRYEITPSIPDVSAASLSTAQQTATVSLPPEMIGLFRVRVSPASGASFSVIISGMDISANPNEATISAASTGGGAAGEFAIRVNASGQIKHRSVGTVGASNIVITSFGWIDTRGRG